MPPVTAAEELRGRSGHWQFLYAQAREAVNRAQDGRDEDLAGFFIRHHQCRPDLDEVDNDDSPSFTTRAIAQIMDRYSSTRPDARVAAMALARGNWNIAEGVARLPDVYWFDLVRQAQDAMHAAPHDSELQRVIENHYDSMPDFGYDSDEEMSLGEQEEAETAPGEEEADEVTGLVASFIDHLYLEQPRPTARGAILFLAHADWDLERALANYHESMVEAEEPEKSPVCVDPVSCYLVAILPNKKEKEKEK